MDLKTQEKTLYDEGIFHTNRSEWVYAQILAAMTAWERQQNHVLRERVYELERDKSITELQLVHSDQRIKELEEAMTELMRFDNLFFAATSNLQYPNNCIAALDKAKHLLTT